MAREFCIQSTFEDGGKTLVLDVSLALDPFLNTEKHFLVLRPRVHPLPVNQRFRVEEEGRIVNVGLDNVTEQDGYLTRGPNGSVPLFVHLDLIGKGDPVQEPLQLFIFHNAEEFTFITLDQARLYLTVSEDHPEVDDFVVIARRFPPVRDGQLWLFEEVTPAIPE